MVQGGKLVMRITYVADSPAFWNSSYGPKGTSRVWTGSSLDALWGTGKGPTPRQRCGLKESELKTEKLWAKRLFPLYFIRL